MTSAAKPELTIRPGLFQTLAVGGAAVGAAWLGIVREAPAVELVLAAPFSFGLIYIVGMQIHLDPDNLSKSYLFGLSRKSIPRNVLTRASQRSTYEPFAAGGIGVWQWRTIDFKNGEETVFSAATWLWSEDDLEAIWDQIHPRPSLFGDEKQ